MRFFPKIIVWILIVSLITVNFGGVQSYAQSSGSEERVISEEEIEALGGAVLVPRDETSNIVSETLTEEDFATIEEYDKYVEETYGYQIQPYYAWLLPPLYALVFKSGSKLLVQQTLRSTTTKLTIRNGHLASKVHPTTGVKFNSNGFPIFESKVNFNIPNNLLKSSNSVQFRNLNAQLKQKYDSDFNFRMKFNATERAQIDKGLQPTGYTWHHHETRGLFQLVKTDKHSGTGHTGGRSIWGSL